MNTIRRRLFVLFTFTCLVTTVGNWLCADSVTDLPNIAEFDDQQYEFTFVTTDTVLSIDSIEIEFSHENVEQVQMFLENIGTGTPYALFTLVNGSGADDAFGNLIGENDGDFTDLSGLASLKFVESGPGTTVRDSVASPVMTGCFLAEDWENNSGTGEPPYSPTTWRVVVRDSTFINDNKGALGRITVNFTLDGVLLGDVNLDGEVNLLDVEPFANCIAICSFQAEADINRDGVINLLDVAPFIDLLLGN